LKLPPVTRPIVRPICQSITGALGGGFSPISLFSGTDKGYIYDNNDLSSFYLDSALTTQASVNGLVGGQKDKSPNLLHRTQSTTGSKPILRGTPVGSNLVTNGDFSSGATGWTADAGIVITTLATATVVTGNLTNALAATAGRNYRVTYTLTRTAGSMTMSMGGRSGPARSAAGTYVDYLDNTTNTNALNFAGSTFSGTVDNVEVVDVTADSVTAPYGLQYDGIDDFLTTASVDFTATDKMFVCAGVRKLSDAAVGMFTELSASADANAGAFYITAPGTAGATFRLVSGGTFPQGVTVSGYTSPFSAVASGVCNIVGDSANIRINGVSAGTAAGDQGTGNYGNYPFFFGRRGGASLPYNGLDFGGICVNKTLSASQLSSAERWTAIRTGVTI
jgi:hypothetical protein